MLSYFRSEVITRFRFPARAIFGVLFFSSSMSASTLDINSPSGIERPEFQTVMSEIDAVVKESNGWAEATVYGISEEGYSLRAITLRKPGVPTQAKRNAIVIMEAIHGDEYLNIADRLPRYFLKNRSSGSVGKFFDGGGYLYIIPVFNPEGYVKKVRGNAKGVDLNRDFPDSITGTGGFTQPETKTFNDYIKREASDNNLAFRLTMSYHAKLFYTLTLPNDVARREEYYAVARVVRESFPTYTDPWWVKGMRTTDLEHFHFVWHATSLVWEGGGASGHGGGEQAMFPFHCDMWDALVNHVNQVGPPITR